MMGLLGIISIWDLLKQEIPVLLLIMFSVISVLNVLVRGSLSWMSICLPMAVLIGSGMIMVQKKKMGGGDVWMLGCLAIAWPIELFWKSVMYGSLLLCVVAIGLLIFTKNENIHIPMIPFLLLGYCI